MSFEEFVPLLPHVNASLNAVAAVMMLVGYAWIKRGREDWHRAAMLGAFLVSMVFLASYMTYHVNTEAVKRFPDYPPDLVRYFYYAILLTHVLLAAVVPVAALATVILALRDRRSAHVRLAKWTLPVWLYVSVTGVAVYLMLYHLYPPL